MRAVRAAAPDWDRPRRTRLRARTRKRRGPAARCESPQKSQTPARMQRHDAAGEAFPLHPRKAGVADHLGKLIGPGELPDRFDEVLIGFRITRHGAAERRDHLERKEIV